MGLQSFNGAEEVPVEFACFVNGEKRWVVHAGLRAGIREKGSFEGAGSEDFFRKNDEVDGAAQGGVDRCETGAPRRIGLSSE